jgi:hypothetical protein
MVMYVVELHNNGTDYFLKGTTWAFNITRANLFESFEEAFKGLHKAKQFTAPKVFKLARIVEVM